ncbi:VWA domain-containing protein [Nocardia sp. NPDC049707]|uniref:VWA domain-containing protein n=1 Tax=Nocardia sp. NPDC049707 TaxID=3154735 RepID=UPI0034412735
MSFSDFAAPLWFAFALVVLALTVGYLLVQRHRTRQTLRFANMELLETVAPKRSGPARHIPVALGLIGLLALTVGLAGPMADKRVPRNRATVILVIDVSLSMQATDVTPSRLAAAQKAAKGFVDDLTPGINLGLVTFAGTASLMVSPTTNHDQVITAIDHLRLAERTATGEGIFTALQAIETFGNLLGGGTEPPPARIVLESDGKQTVPANQNDPRGGYTAARQAKSKKVPVSTISFGTTWGKVEIPREQGDGVDEVPVPVDDAALQQIANLSGGNFFTAASLADLRSAYSTLSDQIGYETVRGDASRPWMILAAVLIAAAYTASLVLRQRIP